MAENIIKFKIDPNVTQRPYIQISTLGNAKVIKQNTNPNKYILFSNMKIYNSAFIVDTTYPAGGGDPYLYLDGFILVDTSGNSLKTVSSASSDMSNPVDWSNPTCNYSTGSGDVYCRSDSGFPKWLEDLPVTNGHISRYVETLEVIEGVPVFTDRDAYYAYIQTTFVPQSGGAGSGYIANPLVISYTQAKKMVGYNVPTSSIATTKTESVNVFNVNPESGKPKSGNGFARIKFLTKDIVPDEYKPYLALINGCNGEGYDFFWKNQTINFPLGGYKDPKMFSYYLERRSYPPSSIVPFAFQAGVADSQGYGSGYGAYHTSLFSLWIVNESGTYKLYFRNYHRYVLNVNIDNADPLYGRYYRGNYKSSGGAWGTFWWDNDRASSSPSTYVEGDSTVRATNSTLAGLLDWCAKHFRNVDIYVDGIPWSKGG